MNLRNLYILITFVIERESNQFIFQLSTGTTIIITDVQGQEIIKYCLYVICKCRIFIHVFHILHTIVELSLKVH